MKRADWVHGESQNLLDRLFDGKLAPVTHFSQTHAAYLRSMGAEM